MEFLAYDCDVDLVCQIVVEDIWLASRGEYLFDLISVRVWCHDDGSVDGCCGAEGGFREWASGVETAFL